MERKKKKKEAQKKTCMGVALWVFDLLSVLFIVCGSTLWYISKSYSPPIQYYTFYPLALVCGARFVCTWIPESEHTVGYAMSEIFFSLVGIVTGIMYSVELGVARSPFAWINTQYTYGVVSGGNMHVNTTATGTIDALTASPNAPFVYVQIIMLGLSGMLYFIHIIIACMKCAAAGEEGEEGEGKEKYKRRVFQPFCGCALVDRLRMCGTYFGVLIILSGVAQILMGIGMQISGFLLPTIYTMPDVFLLYAVMFSLFPAPPALPFPSSLYSDVTQTTTKNNPKAEEHGEQIREHKERIRGEDAFTPGKIHQTMNSIYYLSVYRDSTSLNETLARNVGRVTGVRIGQVLIIFIAWVWSLCCLIDTWLWRVDNDLDVVCLPSSTPGFSSLVQSTLGGSQVYSYWEGKEMVVYWSPLFTSTTTGPSVIYAQYACADDWLRGWNVLFGLFFLLVHILHIGFASSSWVMLKLGSTVDGAEHRKQLLKIMKLAEDATVKAEGEEGEEKEEGGPSSPFIPPPSSSSSKMRIYPHTQQTQSSKGFGHSPSLLTRPPPLLPPPPPGLGMGTGVIHGRGSKGGHPPLHPPPSSSSY
jgi:hypothetical protein